MSFIKDENGVTAVEYGTLVSFGFTLIVATYAYTYTKVYTALETLNIAIS